MDFIESKENPRYRSALNTRKGKDSGLIFVEGARLCEEALESALTIQLALFSKEFLEGAGALARRLEGAARDAAVLKTRLFDSLSDTKKPQGAALVCERPVSGLETVSARLHGPATSVPIALLLLEINNPGNLGAVLRTVEAAGAAGVITSKGSVDAFSPAVLRGSMGASFRLPVAEKVPEHEAVEWARRSGLKVIVTDSNAPADYTEADLTAPALLVFGSEAHGISGAVRESADLGLKIPLENRVESLNLAVSAGVLLFEAKRQARY
ncbi:MAG: RNA methyltransferase [Aridibacter famidurans]|nr:RNA methyltransferase [Aridibacter famidurans]